MRSIAVLTSIAALIVFLKAAVVLDFVNKKCNKTYTFLQFINRTLQECTEECDRRARCTSIMYMQRMKYCSLKDNIVGNTDNGKNLNRPNCVFLEKKDWIPSDLGPCSENKCNATEKCVSSKQDPNKPSCVKSACLLPPVVANAHALSDLQTTGSSNTYMCKNGYRSFGSPVITCSSNAKWNKNGPFRCEPKCKTPKISYTNAVLSRIEYRGEPLFKRQVVHFACKKSYQALGRTVTSTCDRKGKWLYNRIQCCENGTYNKPWDSRCVFYTEPLRNFGQFNEICSARKYSMTWFNVNLGRFLFNSHGIVNMMMPTKKSHYEKYSNFSKCFENANITVVNLTYDERVEFARSNNMTTGYCWSVRIWAPFEPNGGTNENCIMIKINETGYAYYDIPCDNLIEFDIRGVCHWELPVI